MMDMLAQFKHESNELRKLKDEKNEEQLMLNRLVKNEVIDMADRVEEIQRMLLTQNKLIKIILQQNKLHTTVEQDEEDSFLEGEESECSSGYGSCSSKED